MTPTPKTVTREDVLAQLTAWVRGKRTSAEIHAWAEARHAVSAFEPEDAVLNEVLGALDMLDVNLVVVDDVPFLIRALQLAPDESAGVSKVLDSRLDSLDMTTRRRMLRTDPLYSRFCGE